ncbi:hypothetical protein J1N35_013849 [Gossypium stocksii]|uniref:Uncharacterized protein n=1 Tax=Gossypium stocksii TaxID=47602 RepID=A0A9D3VUG6_9ROSI|nr:hypothetical protein J1N35_013849 [Gossypium stocksii]
MKTVLKYFILEESCRFYQTGLHRIVFSLSEYLQVKWSGVRTQHSTTPFIDEMYERLKETLSDYEVIICRWPEYIFVLENAISNVEKAIVEALDKQYVDVVSPLKENLTPKKFGLKYMQKLTK